jgi:hypothetical protein
VGTDTLVVDKKNGRNAPNKYPPPPLPVFVLVDHTHHDTIQPTIATHAWQ